MNLSDHLHKLLGREALQQISAGSGLHRTADFVITLKGCKYDNARLRKFGPYCKQGIDPAEIRHPKVHERNVGTVLTILPDRFPSAGCLRDQEHVRLVSND
jgi:hypothetical protein